MSPSKDMDTATELDTDIDKNVEKDSDILRFDGGYRISIKA
jgi:hypothetical protein